MAPTTADVFGSAPRELARRISLHQTVELVRTTIDVVETQIDEVMPRADRPVLHAAIVAYSREVAFAAAEIYARAAELRGTWDARLEALGGRRGAARRDRRLRAVPGLDPGLDSPTARSSWWSGRPRTWSRRCAELESIRHTGGHRRRWTCSGRCRATG